MEIESLYNAIHEEIDRYSKLRDAFGKNDPYVQSLCYQIYGMKKAFEIITGYSYSDYLVERLTAEAM